VCPERAIWPVLDQGVPVEAAVVVRHLEERLIGCEGAVGGEEGWGHEYAICPAEGVSENEGQGQGVGRTSIGLRQSVERGRLSRCGGHFRGAARVWVFFGG
jgi:hypothetical protein